MANRLPVPSANQNPTGPVWLINILEWLFRVLQELVPLVVGINGVEAKLGVLVGNDAKVAIDESLLPEWVVDLGQRILDIRYKPLNEGCLSFTEVNTQEQTVEWTGFHRMVAAMVNSLVASVTNEIEFRTPYYSSATDTENPGYVDGVPYYKTISSYSSTPNPQTPTLDASVPKPNLLHVVASMVALLTLAQRIPYPVLNQSQIAKLDDVSSNPGTFNGSITDVANAQGTQVLTPTDKITRTHIDPSML